MGSSILLFDSMWFALPVSVVAWLAGFALFLWRRKVRLPRIYLAIGLICVWLPMTGLHYGTLLYKGRDVAEGAILLLSWATALAVSGVMRVLLRRRFEVTAQSAR